MSKARKSEKVFVKWLLRGPERMRDTGEKVVATIVPLIENAGFIWVDKTFDIGPVQANEIALERTNVDRSVDFISIYFDKYRKPKFEVWGGTKRPDTPNDWEWVKGATLVWKQDDGYRYKQWAPNWWQLSRTAAKTKVVNDVARYIPQMIGYLNGEPPGPNVRVSKIGPNRTQKL